MATPDLKHRPIAFVLHDQATGASPVKVDLVIRPEDLQRTDVSRATVAQTLGGAWVDAWGDGISTITISGTTGWGQGGQPNGLEAFFELHKNVYEEWHRLRGQAIVRGVDPDDVKLIFIDDLDEFSWVVIPNQFILRRNKSRPLLAQYQITMTRVDDGEFDRSLAESDMAMLLGDGLSAGSVAEKITGSLSNIRDQWGKVSDQIGMHVAAALPQGSSLGASGVTEVLDGLVSRTNGVIAEAVKSIPQNGNGSTMFPTAMNLARAATNVMNTINVVSSLPSPLSSQVTSIARDYRNIFANGRGWNLVLRSLASASKTALSGSPDKVASAMINRLKSNALSALTSPITNDFAGSALSRLLAMDPATALPSVNSVIADVSTLVNGISKRFP